MTHFRSQPYVGLVTSTFAFDLKLVRIISRGVDNLPTNLSVSRTFRSRLIGQYLSDTLRDLATLTLEATVLVADAGLKLGFHYPS